MSWVCTENEIAILTRSHVAIVSNQDRKGEHLIVTKPLNTSRWDSPRHTGSAKLMGGLDRFRPSISKAAVYRMIVFDIGSCYFSIL